MKHDELARLLEVAKQAAVEAGKAVLELYLDGTYDSYTKSDQSPVTSADYRANEMIQAVLTNTTPDIPIMSEESAHEPLEKRTLWPIYWLVDPIDGTQEFIARSGDFAVNISLIYQNQPVIGVIYWPTEKALYYASKGQGAFKSQKKQTQQIYVRQFNDVTNEPVIIAVSRRQPIASLMSKVNEDREYQTLPLGSCSLKSCIIAEGKADLFLRLGETGEWDTGAPQCIVSEAGGKILDTEFTPLTYNLRNSLINPDFLVLGDQRVNWRNIVLYQFQEHYENP